MKKIILLMFGILILSLVSAVNYSFIFEKGKDIDLHIACFDINKSYCVSTTTCQLSVYYPNQSILISNHSMTYNEVYFNYTISSSKIDKNGIYSCITDCQGSTNAYSTFNFLVTPTGDEITSSQGFVSLGLIGGILAVAFLFIILGFKFAETKWFPISLLFMALSILLSVYSLHLGYIYTESILYPLAVQGGQSAIFIGIMWGMVALIFIGMTFFTMKVIKIAFEQKAKRDYGENYNTKTGMYD